MGRGMGVKGRGKTNNGHFFGGGLWWGRVGEKRRSPSRYKLEREGGGGEVHLHACHRGAV